MDTNAVLKGQVSFTRPLSKNDAFEQALFILKGNNELKYLLDKPVASNYYPDDGIAVFVIGG